MLLNSQKTDLFKIIINSGMDPSTFTWSTDGKGWAKKDFQTLEFGQCYAVIATMSDGYAISIRPSFDGKPRMGEINLTWDKIKIIFNEWIKLVKEEAQYEDPWNTYAKVMPPTSILEFNDNSPFTHAEAEKVSASVTKLIEYLKSKDDIAYSEIAATFDPIAERVANAAKSGIGRIDWSNQLVGMIISICIALSLSPGQASKIWAFWKSLIIQVLEH